MNHYEERKQARIDGYRAKSASAARKSSDLTKQSTDMLSHIPLGQPILVGHHSEKADRSYRAKADNKMRRGVEEADKAGYYADKAEAAENNTAISSDDPEAITKLEAQLAACKANQEQMKAANAYYRKHKTMKGYADISDEGADKIDKKIKDDYSFNRQPYPSYRLTNNSANIRRITKRIAGLKKRDSLLAADGNDENTAALSGWEFDGGSVEMNAEYNRIQIFFDSKPDEETRRELKSNGFKWAPSQGAWQRQINANALFAVKRIKCIQPNAEEVL